MLNKYVTETKLIISLPLLIILVFMLPWDWVDAQSSRERVRDIDIIRDGDGVITLRITGSRGVEARPPEFIDNPPRLIYDFRGTILEYNKGRTSRIPVDSGQLDAIGVSQFQLNPDIVRIVLYFNSGTKTALENSINLTQRDGIINIRYSSKKDATTPRPPERIPVAVPETRAQVFSLLHHILEPDGDVFLIQATESFHDPKITLTEKGANITFSDAEFKIPLENRNYFVVPVNGSLVNEVEVVNQPDSSVLFIRNTQSQRPIEIDCRINRLSGTEIAVEITKRTTPIDKSVSQKTFELRVSDDDDTGEFQYLGSTVEPVSDFESKDEVTKSEEPDFRLKPDEKRSSVVQIPRVHDDSEDEHEESFTTENDTSQTQDPRRFYGETKERPEPGKTPDEKSSGLFRVIAGIYYSEAKAKDIVKSLTQDGFTAIVQTIETSDGYIYRVQAGAFSSRENAVQMADELQSSGYSVEIIRE